MLFHSVLYYPAEISLNFPGFIVGIEKSPVELVSGPDDVKTADIEGSGLDADNYRRKLLDKKVLYISHIVENARKPYGFGNCAHYNIYYRERTDSPLPSIDFCTNSKHEMISPQEAFTKSWSALDILKREMNEKLASGGYTHVMVIVMGWNTDQEEAVRNYNSLVKNIKHASADHEFNPLFIGVTWPSLWESAWFDPIIKGASFTTKANDADEVGFSWLGAILHYSLSNLSKKIPIVVIGHSFGGRATSVASCVGPAISKDGSPMERNRIDLLISLQGAYSINRFNNDKGIVKMKYPDQCSSATHIALTSSEFDTAMDSGFWSKMVGNDKVFKEYCSGNTRENKENFECVIASSSGSLSLDRDQKKQFIYINSDELIRYNAYLSGGGAHSDIYRKETGKMLWDIISERTKIH